jgi:putative flippase GtrA
MPNQLILEQFHGGLRSCQPNEAMLTDAAPARATFSEFVRYIAVGGVSAAVYLLARFLLDFALPFEVAVVLAYGVGMATGFSLFQLVLFRGRDMMQRHRMVRFAWVNVFGVTLAWAVSSVMARQLLPAIGWHWQPFEIAHLAGVAAPAISSYYYNRYYTFA